MGNLIITSGNAKYFNQLKNFIDSLRGNGEYNDSIAVCDNTITGSWDNPGTWERQGSFTAEQLDYFKGQNAVIFTLNELIANNELDENTIEAIHSPTQRYPYKFIYNTLISKKYLNKARHILYFDSDIYFQRPVKELFKNLDNAKINIVKEVKKIKDNSFLSKWIKFSDFSKLSTQQHYLNSMLNADNYCTGFYGGNARTFHNFNLLLLLLTSNKFVNFYSDQPLFNIAHSFFSYPINAMHFSNCLHIGEFDNAEYAWLNQQVHYKGTVPIAVHFNAGKYEQLTTALAGKKPAVQKKTLKTKAKQLIRYVIKK